MKELVAFGLGLPHTQVVFEKTFKLYCQLIVLTVKVGETGAEFLAPSEVSTQLRDIVGRFFPEGRERDGDALMDGDDTLEAI